MSLAQETEMTRSEVDEFVSNRETGVLTLAQNDEPYAIPISYGYNDSSGTFYMRLVSTPESEKRAYLGSSPDVRVVIYDGNDEKTEYRSVVAKGALEELDPADLSADDIVQYGQAERPLFEIWGADRDELDIRLYSFEPDVIEGRRIELDREPR